MLDQCPGAADMKTPTLKINTCPKCGAEVEIFSTDKKVTCGQCGFVVYNEIASCVQWCQYAEQCLGTDLYHELKVNPGKKR